MATTAAEEEEAATAGIRSRNGAGMTTMPGGVSKGQGRGLMPAPVARKRAML